jgi:hypothetical protein
MVQHHQDDDKPAQIVQANLTVAPAVDLLIPHVSPPHDKPAAKV